jgi:DNA-binding response OmpR family regulator
LIFVGTMMLEQSGYKVTGQSDGEAALIEFRQRPNAFDAVSQIFHALHGCERHGQTSMLTSGYIDPQDQISAIRLGVTPVLTKPFRRKKLLAALHDIFQERRELDKSQSVPGGTLSQLAKKKNY